METGFEDPSPPRELLVRDAIKKTEKLIHTMQEYDGFDDKIPTIKQNLIELNRALTDASIDIAPLTKLLMPYGKEYVGICIEKAGQLWSIDSTTQNIIYTRNAEDIDLETIICSFDIIPIVRPYPSGRKVLEFANSNNTPGTITIIHYGNVVPYQLYRRFSQ
jgi:hypothetical protein